MGELDDIRKHELELAGNRVLPIDDPDTVWIVDSGRVAVFCMPLEGSRPCGPRRYGFDRGPGEALFGVGRFGPGGRQALVAVALEPTTLRRMSAVRLQDGSRRIADWVEQWRAALGPSVELPAVEPTDEGSLVPFHAELAEQLLATGQEAERSELERLGERVRHSNALAQQAVGQLNAALRPEAPPPSSGSPVFVAASLVGRVMGLGLRSAGTAERGVAKQVEAISRASHIRHRKVLLHDGWWQQDCGPILAFTRNGRRPVALLPRGAKAYRLVDPSGAPEVIVDARTAATLDPEAYVFYAPLPEDATSTVQLLRFALRGRGRDLAVILVTGVAATLLGMLTPLAMALLVDHAIPDAEPGLLLQMGLGLGAAALGSAIFLLGQGIAMLRLETGADAATQAAVWDRLLNLQLSFFRRFSTGDLQSRVTAVGQIRAYLGGTTLRSLFSSVILLLNLALLLYYSPPLTLVALGVATLSATVTLGSGIAILRYARRILELRGRFFGLMVQLVNGVAKLRVAAAEQRAFARWAGDFSRLVRLELDQSRVQDTVQVLNIAVSTLSTIALFAYASTLVGSAEDALTTGTFLAFNVAYGTFIGAIVNLSNTVTDVMAIAILRERARPILEAQPEISERRASPGRLAGRLELDHVSFQYREDGPQVLDDVSLRVEPGWFVAIVGRSGSGKSTLFRLLLGFETPQAGTIYYDGQDLSGLDVLEVRRQMGVVLQVGRINSGSIFDNIAAGAHVSLNDAWEAARAAGFDEEIKAMPMGLHTIISEGGTNLSGGQRQRLLIARALVHHPTILLLDEATSALDNNTQAVVSASLERLNVTRVVIAHRLSTIRKADRIYVLDSGRIVQQGSFDELAAVEGLFARLMARQMT